MSKLRKNIYTFLLDSGISQDTLTRMYIKIYSLWKNIKKPGVILVNFYLYKTGKRLHIEYILRKKMLFGNESFGDNDFYQSYPPLNFNGERNSELRVVNYKLKKYLNTNQSILDIGGNTGFFSLYISNLVKYIDVIEYSKTLVDMGNILKEYQQIKNVFMTQIDFKEFKIDIKYDVIFSLAVHKWIGVPFYEYIEKLFQLLKEDGILFIESQNLEIDPFEEKITTIKLFFSIEEIIDIKEPKGYIRKLVICKKIKNSF